jgi:hypothetical protein
MFLSVRGLAVLVSLMNRHVHAADDLLVCFESPLFLSLYQCSCSRLLLGYAHIISISLTAGTPGRVAS